jgi:hypothetical protein
MYVYRSLFSIQTLKYLDVESDFLLFISRLYFIGNMFLMYYLSDKGERVYTFKVRPFFFVRIFLTMVFLYVESRSMGKSYTIGSSRYSRCLLIKRNFKFYYYFLAKFSPDDQYSRQRLKLKTRYRLLLTQTPLSKC